jgi:hypothetical protein
MIVYKIKNNVTGRYYTGGAVTFKPSFDAFGYVFTTLEDAADILIKIQKASNKYQDLDIKAFNFNQIKEFEASKDVFGRIEEAKKFQRIVSHVGEELCVMSRISYKQTLGSNNFRLYPYIVSFKAVNPNKWQRILGNIYRQIKSNYKITDLTDFSDPNKIVLLLDDEKDFAIIKLAFEQNIEESLDLTDKINQLDLEDKQKKQ